MDLIRHLGYFVAIADEGHFGRAATVLDMTQPPLSQGLRRLESRLGVELVHRTRQGAVLTAAGRQLLPRARLLVDDAQRLLAEAQRIARTRGTVHWGATSALPDRIVTACVTGLRTGNTSGEAVSTDMGTTVDLVTAVRSGLCDLAVIEHPALVDGVEARSVVKLPRWIVVPAGHRSAATERPAFPMLADLTYAAYPRAANPPPPIRSGTYCANAVSTFRRSPCTTTAPYSRRSPPGPASGSPPPRRPIFRVSPGYGWPRRRWRCGAG